MHKLIITRGKDGLAGRDVKELTHTFASAHICQRQMCLFTPKGARAHICQRQMCLPASEGARAHICQKQMC